MEAKHERHLRTLLDTHFRESGVYDSIDVDAGVDVDAVIASLSAAHTSSPSPAPPPPTTSTPEHNYLELRLGRCTHILGPEVGKVFCSVLLQGTLHTTTPVPVQLECAELDAQVYIPLQIAEGKHIVKEGLPLHIILIHCDQYSVKTVLCEAEVEWREVLTTETSDMVLNLRTEGMPVAAAELSLSLRWHSSGRALHSVSEVSQYLSAEKQEMNGHRLLFSSYAKSWAETEGCSAISTVSSIGEELPFTAWVVVIPPHPTLPTPMHAAHYAALPRHDDGTAVDVVAHRAPRHVSLQHLLSTASCTIRERCCLLCSLLLGYGLDAYVIITHTVSGEVRYYVATRESEVFLWDSLTGRRQLLCEFSVVSKILVAFNDKEIHQFVDNNAANSLVLNFDDMNTWRSPDPSKWRLLRKQPAPKELTLHDGPQSAVLDKHLEEKLCFTLAEYRKEQGLSGRVLCAGEVYNVLGQALWQRECETITACSSGVEPLVQAACRFSLPRDHTMVAHPRHYASNSEALIASHLLGNAQTRALIETDKSNTFVVLRCKIARYPEGLMSTWVIVAAVHSK